MEPDTQPDYFRQIGRNTSYIIHPEEVLADNFSMMVLGRKEIPNPEIVEAIREYFLKPADKSRNLKEGS